MVQAKMITGSFVALSDLAILDLLRKQEAMTVAEFAEALGVTATAVRQRLNRLMAQHLIERSATKNGRGRPKHRYRLTSKGLQKAGSNFSDLAVALWQEVRAIRDPDVRRGLLQRVARRMAVMYAGTVEGKTLEQKLLALADLFGERRVPLELDKTGSLPILKAVACPYPELADQDRSICAMERMLFAEMLGADVRLAESRLDGKSACIFELN
jgi:predicted ArsR family transcriptional regulator